jgi:hypothetical protein
MLFLLPLVFQESYHGLHGSHGLERKKEKESGVKPPHSKGSNDRLSYPCDPCNPW